MKSAVVTASVVGMLWGLAPQVGRSQEAASSPAEVSRSPQIEEITVTARRREESLQEVPDAITVLSAEALENAGIRDVGGFMDRVPNLTFRDGSAFRKGDIRISMRGIGNGQEGWAPVTFLIDGVPAGSLDAINSGSLEDVERIEVLRGPQSALYGAGAIAGAINIITQRPTNDMRLRVNGALANGNDRRIGAALSGPLVDDRLLFQLRSNWRSSDGLIDSASNGIDLDFERQKKVATRLIFAPNDVFEADLRAEWLREENGATYQDKIASVSLIDEFDDSTRARRRFPGEDDRELSNFSLRMQANLGSLTATSVTGYSEIDQEVTSSLCWDDPDAPAVDGDPLTPGAQSGCLFGLAFGSAALPGQPIDNLFNSLDNFETFTQDMRLQSASDQALRWVIGASILKRETLTGFDASLILAPDESVVTLFPAWHAKEDEWWGVYGELSWDATERLEITAALRYDDNEYRDTQYTSRGRTAVVPVPDKRGHVVATQIENADEFQPKVQLRYQLLDDVMVYATWSRGFRAGSFNTGAFTLPERSTNYEVGAKTLLFDRRMALNAAVFHIDYSDQQFSTVIPAPPFRLPVTIPETRIDGVELETTVLATQALSLSAGVGYLDSRERGDIRSPIAPQWTANLAADLVLPIAADWSFRAHGDYRYTSALYLSRNELTRIEPKDFVSARIGVESLRWKVMLFAENLFDTRQMTTEGTTVGGGYVRAQNRPRSYGVEVGYRY
jgi:iron complex outermembrane recepter protein